MKILNQKSCQAFFEIFISIRGRVVTVIVCEGETELNYFNALKREYRLSFLTVKLCETGSSPINVVKYAIEFAENNEAIDQIFCVFDRDQHSTFDEANWLHPKCRGTLI